jgi:hypothetical protein
MNSVMFSLKTSQFGVKTIVHGKGNLVDLERVGVDMLKGVLLLVLDEFLEVADFLFILDLDAEDVTRTITEN